MATKTVRSLAGGGFIDNAWPGADFSESDTAVIEESVADAMCKAQPARYSMDTPRETLAAKAIPTPKDGEEK